MGEWKRRKEAKAAAYWQHWRANHEEMWGDVASLLSAPKVADDGKAPEPTAKEDR